jgi:phosphopantetheinyl transferase (holo-ACP synthase)
VIGNDIVDLNFLDSPSYQHVGHLARVCTEEELHAVRIDEQPSLTLGALWAAKEASYKLLSKKTKYRFVPRQFAVRFANQARRSAAETALVTYDGIVTRVELSLTENWVHAIAFSTEGQAVRWSIREIARCFRNGRQARDESEAVRFLARELVARYCQDDLQLDFHGGIPILTLQSGGHAAIDVSFSHHGKYAAVGVACPLAESWAIIVDSGLRGYAPEREETCFTCTA